MLHNKTLFKQINKYSLVFFLFLSKSPGYLQTWLSPELVLVMDSRTAITFVLPKCQSVTVGLLPSNTINFWLSVQKPLGTPGLDSQI